MSMYADFQSLGLNFKNNKTEESFNALYTNMRIPLVRYAVGIVKDKYVAEDLYNEVMLSVYNKIDDYDESLGKFSTWAFSIMRYACLNHIKRHSSGIKHKSSENVQMLSYNQILEEGIDLAVEYPDFIEYIEDEECYIDVIADAVDRLSPKFKEIILSRFFVKRSYNQIAKELFGETNTKNTGKLRARCKLAKKHLKEQLQNEPLLASWT